MSQTTEIQIQNQPGLQFRTNLNLMLSALNTTFAGNTAPTVTEAYHNWLDTSTVPNVLKRRNSANTAWETHPLQVKADDALPKAGGEITGSLGVGITAKHTLDVYRLVTGGSPAASGSASDPNASMRIQSGTTVADWGAYSTGNLWLQARLASDYSQKYGLALNPSGGEVSIGAETVGGTGSLQVVRSSVTGGNPASSGTTDANQVATIGNDNAVLRSGFYANGDAWLQPSLKSNYSTNYGLSICPIGGTVAIGSNGNTVAKFAVTGSVSYTIPTTFAGATGNAAWTTGQASQAVPLSIYASDRLFCAGVYTASDRRVKDNITAIPEGGALDFCRNVETVSFDWNVTGLHDTGFIAQDLLAKGYGHLVSGIPDSTLEEHIDEYGNISPAGTKLIARYEAVVPILTAAIRALDKQNTELELRLAELERRL